MQIKCLGAYRQARIQHPYIILGLIASIDRWRGSQLERNIFIINLTQNWLFQERLGKPISVEYRTGLCI